ncbi:hypothetical protein MY4038_003393 [Beauveria bassiana]
MTEVCTRRLREQQPVILDPAAPSTPAEDGGSGVAQEADLNAAAAKQVHEKLDVRRDYRAR